MFDNLVEPLSHFPHRITKRGKHFNSAGWKRIRAELYVGQSGK
jgi:hypothetical protein